MFVNTMKNRNKLALYGGEKVRSKPMPPRMAVGIEEKKQILKVLEYYRERKEDPPYDGYFQRNFEREFVKRMQGGYAAAVCSGSVACFIGIRALSLPKNSEVIVSPVTDSGSLFAIIECGLKPVVVDSENNTYNTSWNEIKRGISNKTSALFLVHCSGNALNMREIRRESRKLGIKIIEDCSQAPFAKSINKSNKNLKISKNKSSKFVGSFSDVAVYSTMYRKNLQTGGSGGIVYSSKYNIYKNIVEQSDRGRPKWSKNYNSRDPGQAKSSALNFNTDELSCAIGLASLAKIDKTISKRLKFLKTLSSNMKNENLIFDHAYFDEGTSPFLLPIIIKDKYCNKKKAIAKMLLHEGIDLSPEYNCVISEWNIVKKLGIKVIKDTNASSMKERSFNLFLNEKYSQSEVKDIINAFKKVSSFFI